MYTLHFCFHKHSIFIEQLVKSVCEEEEAEEEEEEEEEEKKKQKKKQKKKKRKKQKMKKKKKKLILWFQQRYAQGVWNTHHVICQEIHVNTVFVYLDLVTTCVKQIVSEVSTQIRSYYILSMPRTICIFHLVLH